MRRVAANLQPVKLGEFPAVPSIRNFVRKIRPDRAAVLSGRAAIIAALPNIARTRQADDARNFASPSSEPFLFAGSKTFTDISWDEEEDDGIDDI